MLHHARPLGGAQSRRLERLRQQSHVAYYEKHLPGVGAAAARSTCKRRPGKPRMPDAGSPDANRHRRAQAPRLRHRHVHPQHPDRAVAARSRRPSTWCCAGPTMSSSGDALGPNFRDGRRRRRRPYSIARAVQDPAGAGARARASWCTSRTTCCRRSTRCRSVVTIHDCIHLMFPQYLPNRLALRLRAAARCGARRERPIGS